MTPSTPLNTASRKLSIYAYFEALQFEWICNDLREKIYQRDADKKHWKTVKDGKKIKIEDIAKKNNLPTIFDDEDMAETFNKKVYREIGLPNFIYKDDRQRAIQEFYDMNAYFHKGIDIRVDIAGEIVVCKIVAYKPYEQTLKARKLDGGQVLTFNVKECSRIM